MPTERIRQILAEVMVGDQDRFPERLCQVCADRLPISGAGLAFMTSAGHEGTIMATDGAAAVLEDLQQVLGEGPCVDAFRDGRPVLQPDLATTGFSRWPGFAEGALQAGVAAVFAFPLQVGAIRVGVLDLYRDSPGGLDSPQLSEALAFTEAAVTVLLHLQGKTPPGQLMHPRLAEVAESRREIHQATGMITIQAAVGLAEALLLLQAHAFGSERPLLEVAKDVVARRLRFGPEGDHHG
ncbi:GAF domain-containing protein [Streptomyces sp. SID13031]|uniref:GAF domain-containing protein n=1 Tax=Streptomyces sp. SID13031 TaxID=2706046 RepID=UPI0013C742B8|nr:GAF domain-containing protein [Streptomyces sp. SID13031]NEA34435.1 GAF domain-containing protein [Streptomyces sp. SID13031]